MNYTCIILFYIILFVNYCYGQTDLGDACATSIDEPGVCKYLYDCPSAIQDLKKNDFHTLKRCGFISFTEVVCCPSELTSKKAIPEADLGQTTESLLSLAPALSTTTTTTTKKPQTVAEYECQRIIDSYPPPTGSYIVGGDKVVAGEYPYMVALAYLKTDDLDGDKLEFACGGVLMSASFVLTTAHCISNPLVSSVVLVRVGVVDISGNLYNNSTDYNVTGTIVHPGYKRPNKYHDIAFLRLQRKVTFSDVVHPACLYTDTNVPDNTRNVVVTGFGVEAYGDDYNNRSMALRKAVLRLIPKEECQKFYKPIRSLTNGIVEGMICAGDIGKLKDSCQGDSGGPLSLISSSDGHYRVIGLTSFGRGCGGQTPGVYTYIPHYLPWIESILWPSLELRSLGEAG